MAAPYTLKSLTEVKDSAPDFGLEEFQQLRFAGGDLDALDAVRVAPTVTRSFEAGPDGLELLAFGPRQEADGEVFFDRWTR
jgi:hypothetical protein